MSPSIWQEMLNKCISIYVRYVESNVDNYIGGILSEINFGILIQWGSIITTSIKLTVPQYVLNKCTDI